MPSLAPPPPIPSQVAEHRLSLQGDILHIEIVGNLDLQMIKQLVPIYQACIDHFGYLLLLMDVRQSSGFDADARRYAVEWAKDCATVQAAAVYGAPVLVRGFLTLLNRATFLLSQGSTADLRFVASQDEGRAWLGSRRGKLQQAATERAKPR